MKFHVVEALGEIGDRSALPAVLPLYSEKSLRKPVLEAIGKIERYTANLTYPEFAENEEKVDAVVRNLEIIGGRSRDSLLPSEGPTGKSNGRKLRACATLDP